MLLINQKEGDHVSVGLGWTGQSVLSGERGSLSHHLWDNALGASDQSKGGWSRVCWTRMNWSKWRKWTN